MATAAQAIERIAKETGTLPATVFRAARALREADASMWPQGTQGRGQAAHVEPHHLVNLALAMAVADPITAAPRMVADYRQFACTGIQELRPERMDRVARLFLRSFFTSESAKHAEHPRADFVFSREGGLGADLERLVETLAGPDQSAAEALRKAGLTVELAVGQRSPRAELTYVVFDFSGELAGKERRVCYTPPQDTDRWSSAGDSAETLIARKAILHLPIFNVLADLWNDTKQQRANTLKGKGKHKAQKQGSTLAEPTPEASGSAPGDETAATPGREAAAPNDQPAKAELDGT